MTYFIIKMFQGYIGFNRVIIHYRCLHSA
jgi:hypothetical protein